MTDDHIADRTLDRQGQVRLYAKLDHFVGAGKRRLALLDCVGAEWFDHHAGRRGLMTMPFDDASAREHISIVAVRAAGLPRNDSLWFDLTVGPATGRVADEYDLDALDGGLAQLFASLIDPGAIHPIVSLSTATREDAARLGAAGSLKTVDDGDPDTIARWLTLPVDRRRIDVHHVGQGNLNAVSVRNVPRIFFDFGGGVLGNAKTFPRSKPCPRLEDESVVVLSHWDWDHWSSASRFPYARGLKWIVPDQGSLGPTHAVFLAKLRSEGTVVTWPRTRVEPIVTDGVTLQRATGSRKNRNASGLALTVEVDGRAALLPGDAGYQFLDHPDELGFLVAAHHGGQTRTSAALIPRSDGSADSTLAFSFGKGNTYGHPSAGPRELHEKKWPTVRETANGQPGGRISYGWSNRRTGPLQRSGRGRAHMSGTVRVRKNVP